MRLRDGRVTVASRAEAMVRSCERPCLVGGGFPPSGPQEDLTTTCPTSLFCVHAEHTKSARSARRGAALTRAKRSRWSGHLSERRARAATRGAGDR
jgi:hypothetical protein